MMTTIYIERQKNPEISGFHKKFFKTIDDYLKNNINKITGKEIGYLYYDFWHELKEWRGTSASFTGYSEFLLLRSLMHTLEGEKWALIPNSNPTKPNDFESNKYLISQAKVIKFQGKNRAPDICLWNKDQNCPEIVVEIKININNGQTQINRIRDNFNLMRSAYPDVKALLIVYNRDGGYDKYSDQLNLKWWGTTLLEEDERSISQIYLNALSG